MSVRLHMIVEGQTEKRFVDDVLVPHLATRQVYADARCVLTSRDGPYWYRGGLGDYTRPHRDISFWMKQESANPDARFTTMFDLYALPSEFPGHAAATQMTDPYQKVAHLENALATDFQHPGFIPYIQLHEFEALILVDPQQLDCEFLDHDRAIRNIVEMCTGKEPERINDGSETAPSKRIIEHIPQYADQKASAGPAVVRQIGLDQLRARCPHFAEWLGKLEGLAGE